MGNIFSVSLSAGDTIITRCWDCAAGQARFIYKLEENLDALKTEVAEFKELRTDVMRRVTTAEEQRQLKRLGQVDGWLMRAQTVITEADLLIAESPLQINKLCMGGCCSRHPRSNHKFGKQIARKLQEVKDQKSKGDFSMVADQAPLPSVTLLPSEPTVGLGSTFDKVWSSIQEEHVGVIGLYGLGGVGKTTLLHQINNRFHDTPHDYHVIWVVVSQDMQIQKLQQEVGKRIGFSDEVWKHKRLDEKATDIFNVLYKKKFVFFLDDIWEHIDLTRVGIPLPTQENGSKVIFTTRSFDVCSQMEAQKKIKVECLPKEKALKLFEKKVGVEILDGHPNIRKLAEVVVEECAGLPLALITIGRAMASKKTPEEWKYAIEALRQSNACIFPQVGKEMYPKLKFSYDCLPDERVKSCFLYCSLYPEDDDIDKDGLIDCWIAEGFLCEHSNYNNDVKNLGHCIIRSLVDACLLVEEEDEYVKMHDVIRDMALWIGGESEKEKEKFFVKTGMQLEELPVAEKWKNVRRMTLMKNKIKNLTEILACPNLQTLFLGDNELELISNDFFNSMPMLRILDLSRNMQHLIILPVGIAKLVSLEHLNLSETRIRELPIELKALEKLKYLNLQYTYELRRIPQQLISSFSKLQVLKMFQYGGEEWLVEEIEHLKDLELLTISFKSASMLERALGSYKFKSCNVQAVELAYISDLRLLNISGLANLQHLCALELRSCCDLEEVDMKGAGIASAGCFHSLRIVDLLECSRLRDASWVIFAPHLEILTIGHCQNFEKIMSEEKVNEVGELMENLNLFSKLRVLQLWSLPKLKTICRDALSFPRLKEIEIIYCPMLKKLPLNSNSAKGQKIAIQAEKEWWENLEWEDEATRTAFLFSFKVSD